MNTRKIVPALVPTVASKQTRFIKASRVKYYLSDALVDFMSRTPEVTYGYRLVLLITIFTAVGCGSIVVPPQPDVDRREVERTPPVQPTPPVERIPDVRDSAKVEIVGTVERVDKTKNEIQLRTTEANVIVIKYDPATLVYSRERQVGIEALRLRDLRTRRHVSGRPLCL